MSYLTSHLGLEFLYPGAALTSQIEFDRFNIIDSQIEAIYKNIGTIKNGWEISSTSPGVIDTTYSNSSGTKKYVYLSPGKGVINSIGCETTVTYEIEILAKDFDNYLYFVIGDETPMTKVPILYVSLDSFLSTIGGNITYLKLGKVNFNSTTNTYTITPADDTDAVEAAGTLISDLIKHIHGREGVSKIDLQEEVLGTLSSDNITDIDPSRINSGVLSPSIIELSHLFLKDSGELTHSEIDSAVEFLKNANKKLFGELTTSNFLQMYLSVKQKYETIDKYFRNLISILPGYGNIGYAYNISNIYYGVYQDTFLDVFSYVPSDDQDSDGTYLEKDYNSTKISNPAIVDFWNHEVRGYGATAFYPDTVSIDTKVEFDSGNFDENYIEVIGETLYAYGYGYGFGLGSTYFDIDYDYSQLFGGSDSAFGLGLGYFADSSTDALSGYFYGYGYEVFIGNSFDENKVIVRLKTPSSELMLFDVTRDDYYISNPDDNTDTVIYPYNSDGEIDDAEVGSYDPNKFIVHTLQDSSTTKTSWKNSILRYEVNSNQESTYESNLDNIYKFNKVRISFDHSRINNILSRDESIADPNYFIYDSPTYGYGFYLDFIFKDVNSNVVYNQGYSVPLIFEKLNSSPEIGLENIYWWGYLPGYGYPNFSATEYKDSIVRSYDFFEQFDDLKTNGYSLKYIDIKPNISCDVLSSNTEDGTLTYMYKQSFNPTSDSGDLNIGNNLNDVVFNINDEFFVYPLIWGYTIDEITLIKDDEYLVDKENNVIDQLYFDFPSQVKIDSISWISDEPSDSDISIYFRYSTISREDLENCDYEDNSYYSNNDDDALDSGVSLGGSVYANHVELKIVLTPSSDLKLTPELNSVTLHYIVSGLMSSITIDGSSFFENSQSTSERKNVERKIVDGNTYLSIKNYDNINKIYVGSTGGYLSVYKMQNDGQYDFQLEKSQVIYGEKSIYQMLGGFSEECNTIYSCRYLDNGDLVIADAINHRILIVDGKTFLFKKGIYGSIGYTSSDQSDAFSVKQAIFNKLEKSIYIIFSHMLGEDISDIEGNAFTKLKISSDIDYVEIPIEYSNEYSINFKNALEDEKNCIRIPSGYFIYNVDSLTGNLVELNADGGKYNSSIDNPSNILYINLTQSQYDSIISLGNNLLLNFTIYNDTVDTGGNPIKSYSIPFDESNFVGDLSISKSCSISIEIKNIYYRPIINPFNVEIVNDGKLAISNIIPTKEGTLGEGEVSNVFNLYDSENISYVSCKSIIDSIQIYDINSDSLDFMDICNTEMKNCAFSYLYYGSFKEISYINSEGIESKSYLLSDSLGKNIYRFNIDSSGNFESANPLIAIDNLIENIDKNEDGDTFYDYYISSFNYLGGYYYLSIIGKTSSSFIVNNFILKIASSFSGNTATFILEDQVIDPSSINLNNNLNLTADGRLIITV